MPFTKTTFTKNSYPGDYTPKHQILKVLSEGFIIDDNPSLEAKVEISESNENYKIQLTIPGMKRENLLVTINDEGNLSILSLNMKKTEQEPAQQAESELETILKEIPLPDYVDTSFTSASCHAGTLTIFFIKADEPVAKRPSTIVVY